MAAIVGSLLAELNIDKSGLTNGLRAAGVDMSAFERNTNQRFQKMDRETKSTFASMGKSVAGFGKSSLLPLTAGLTAALAPMALFGRAMRELDEAANLVRLSERIGLGTDSIQALQHAAQLAGVNIDTMGDGLGDFAAKTAEAASGAGTLHEIFKANNVQLRDADGKMRSTRDLLGEYANLIKNAGSEQERLFLAQEAFGDEAAKMLGIFKDGASGLAEIERAAKDAGRVVDSDLLERAAELDRRWDAMWQNFDANAKSAILSAVTYLDSLISKANEIGNAGIFKRLAETLPTWGGADLTYLDPDLARAHGQELGPDARIRDAFAGEMQQADEALVEALRQRYGAATQKAATTIIPGGSDDDSKGSKGKGRNAAAAAAIREAEAVLRVIESLKEERELIGATDLEREKANAVRHAGKAATAEQRAEIEMLVEAIYRESEAMEGAQQAAEFFQETAANAFMDLIPAIETGNSALDRFLNTLIEAVAQAALLGTGPLGWLFGSIMGGIMGGIGGGTNWASLSASGKYLFDDGGCVGPSTFIRARSL